jgi:tetratricopeptide (TPR) repeat protein
MELLRRCVVASAFLAFLAVAAVMDTPAFALTQQQIDWCVNTGKAFLPDLAIDSCTEAIQSGQWSGKDLAWAFIYRGIAWSDKGEYDRANADYTEAIRLDPCRLRGPERFDQVRERLAVW